MNKKLELFRKLIKEAVREVVREELKLLKEQLINEKPSLIENKIKPSINRYEEFLPKRNNKPTPVKTTITNKPSNNPIEKLIQETKNSMGGDEMKQLMNIGPVENGGGSITANINQPINIDPRMMESIGEIEEWEPKSMNLPQFPQ